MKQTTVNNIEQSVSELFNVRGQIKNLKIKEAALQEEVNAYSDAHISDFVNGQLPLENGIVKIQQNPPKLVHVGSEKALTTAERELFTEALAKDYVQTKPNLSKMIARLNGDKLLKKLLEAKGVLVIQGSKYVAKPY